jgi:hypothetical protein
MGGQQPLFIPRKPRDRSKIIKSKMIIRLLNVYIQLQTLNIEKSKIRITDADFQQRFYLV